MKTNLKTQKQITEYLTAQTGLTVELSKDAGTWYVFPENLDLLEDHCTYCRRLADIDIEGFISDIKEALQREVLSPIDLESMPKQKKESGYLRNIKNTIKYEYKGQKVNAKFKRTVKLLKYKFMAEGRYDLARKFVY
jgi:hypothetical protein